jgi:hypothetical protein
MALRSDKRKPHPLIVRCFLAGLLVLLPFYSIQSKSKRQLQPCSAIKVDPAKLRRASPPGCVDMKFSDGSMIVIQYGRPKLQNPHNGGGREVIGFVVPYGEVWRAGANEATSFVTDTNLTIGNASVPAGAYTLYVLPERREPWKLIINKTTGQLRLPYPGESSDLARIDMDSGLQRKTVDQFTITFESQSDNAATLSLEWEGWRAAVKIAKQPSVAR